MAPEPTVARRDGAGSRAEPTPDTPHVTVIIPTFDRCALVRAAIDGLAAQTYPSERFEVIVVDDGSTDGTYGVLSEQRTPFDLLVLRHRSNRGPGAARNTAVARARGTILLFTDSDCVPRPGWIAAMVHAVDVDGLDVAQGRTVPDPDVSVGPWIVTQDLDGFTGRYETCNIAYSASLVRAVGGFPEDLGLLGDDVALGLSARRVGARCAFVPEAIVEHAVTDPGYAWFLRRACSYEFWNLLVRRFPEVRRELLTLRMFVRPADAELVMLVAGLVLARRWRPAVLAGLPYLRRRWPRHLDRGSVLGSLKAAGFDAAIVATLARGSLRHRCLVL